MMRLTVDERKEVAKTIYTALSNAKGDKLVNVTATCIKDEYCIELTLDKVLRNAINRAQIWVCATRIDIWYGRLFALAFDGVNNELFTSSEFLDKRTVKEVKQELRTSDNVVTVTYKERLVRYNSVDEFIPVVLDNIVNIAQGANGVNLDNILEVIANSANNAQESIAQESENAQGAQDNAQESAPPKTSKQCVKRTTKKSEGVKDNAQGEKKRTGRKQGAKSNAK